LKKGGVKSRIFYPYKNRKLPLTIGLTGGIGAGKSSVLEHLKKRGFPVLETDLIGHHLLEEKKIKKVLVRKFGTEIIDKKGKINRKKLGEIVFNHSRYRNSLNRLLHPIIRKRVKRWVSKQYEKKAPYPLIFVEVPLLFEGKGYPYFHGVLSVSSFSALRHKRLKRRGWSLNQIRQRERGQWTQSRKDRQANWVVLNNGTIKKLHETLDNWLDRFND
jgi:dephospho-CoA kinase